MPVRTLYSAVNFLGVSGVTKSNRTGLVLVGAGTMLTSMVVAGFLLGYAVDTWLQSRPVFMLICGGLGVIGGFMKVSRLLSRLG